jgi:UDP-glucose 4-epimerase
MNRPRWVIGRGLLGRSIAAARPDETFWIPVRWDDPVEAVADLRAGMREFSQQPGELEIYWCAGKGVTSTSEHLLAQEVGVFEEALRAATELPAPVRARLRVFLASSVGGAYAGASAPPFTESTPVAPLSPYGRAKLTMEALLREATDAGGWRSLVGRITNIYGPGQNLAKAQGLISVLMAGQLTGRPVSVYVPLDTLRDYIFESDCAAIIDAGVRRLDVVASGTTVTKIIGTMRAVSIGAILGEIARMRRRHGGVILGGGDSAGQAIDLRVRSEVWPDLDSLARTTLPEGLARIQAAQLASLTVGPHA